ncbi:HAMP domain-containing protein [Paraburkholderia sp. BCC1884]|uniref:HAMP domain-containing sensor histidine kinase n=1 Tax=Paraburkholderia sp. BCC1884 TaxID=2562668 RepID=UPI001183E483|nr:HAMP domain-containing protein [Paraburkholderia sp. BCC1884]
MMLASCAGVIVTVLANAVLDNRRVTAALSSPALAQAFEDQLAANAPLLAQARRSTTFCELAMHELSAKVLSGWLPDIKGPNHIERALDSGRVAVKYRWADGQTCLFPRSAVAAQENGKMTTLTVHPATDSGATLTVSMVVLSPIASLLHSDDVSWAVIWLYVLVINFCSVLVLVPLLVKRIKKAERAASAWTDGDLTARIEDAGKDEFGRLTNSFDDMADALSAMIEMKLALAASEERNRLARDLHDTAKQRAFALGLQITALKTLGSTSTRSVDLTQAALALVSHLQQDLADIIRRLSAPTIAELGLRRALSEGIDALLAGSGAGWTLHLSHSDEQALEAVPDVARQLLLISIEACANVLKHADANRVDVAFTRVDDTYHLKIVDDGRGFDVRRGEVLGMGLSNMRLRANSLPHGRLSLVSRTGNGTEITVSFQTTR